MTTQRGIRGVARAAGILAPTNRLTVSSRRQTSGPLPNFIPPPRETAPDVGNSPSAAVSGWTSKGVNAGAVGSAAFESQSLDLGTESPVDEGSHCVGALAEGPVISVERRVRPCLSELERFPNSRISSYGDQPPGGSAMKNALILLAVLAPLGACSQTEQGAAIGGLGRRSCRSCCGIAGS